MNKRVNDVPQIGRKHSKWFSDLKVHILFAANRNKQFQKRKFWFFLLIFSAVITVELLLLWSTFDGILMNKSFDALRIINNVVWITVHLPIRLNVGRVSYKGALFAVES